MAEIVTDTKTGISMRLVREWTPQIADFTQHDKALMLAMSDPRDDDTPFATKLADAREYIRLHTH